MNFKNRTSLDSSKKKLAKNRNSSPAKTDYNRDVWMQSRHWLKRGNAPDRVLRPFSSLGVPRQVSHVDNSITPSAYGGAGLRPRPQSDVSRTNATELISMHYLEANTSRTEEYRRIVRLLRDIW